MKVRIKSGECPRYLTVGKVYEAHVNKDIREDAFVINCDTDGFMMGFFDNCRHLKGGSWEVVDD